MDTQDLRLIFYAVAKANGHSHPEEWVQRCMDEYAAADAPAPMTYKGAEVVFDSEAPQ